MMSAPIIDYLFVLHGMSKKHLRSYDLEGEIINKSMKNRHVSFKMLKFIF